MMRDAPPISSADQPSQPLRRGNAPIILAGRVIASPPARGNTVILKASGLSLGTRYLFGNAFRDAVFPPGVVNVVTNAPADASLVVEARIAHPKVRRINFTGSTRIGRVVAERRASMGRLCISTERQMIDRKVTDEFAGKLGKRRRRCLPATRAMAITCWALLSAAKPRTESTTG